MSSRSLANLASLATDGPKGENSENGIGVSTGRLQKKFHTDPIASTK